MFCSQCGKKLEPNHLFCAGCGYRINQMSVNGGSAPQAQIFTAPAPRQVAQPVYPAQPLPGEAVVWVFQATRKLSMLKAVACSLVFMRDRVVVAHLTPELQKAESARLSQDIKSQGIGVFKGSAAMMRYWSEYYKKYYTMNTGAILAEDPMNTVIQYHMLSELYFRCYYENLGDENSNATASGGELHLTLTNGDKLRFTHRQTDDSSVRDALAGLLGKKLKYKR